jgi:hypothetical protein
MLAFSKTMDKHPVAPNHRVNRRLHHALDRISELANIREQISYFMFYFAIPDLQLPSLK